MRIIVFFSTIIFVRAVPKDSPLYSLFLMHHQRTRTSKATLLGWRSFVRSLLWSVEQFVMVETRASRSCATEEVETLALSHRGVRPSPPCLPQIQPTQSQCDACFSSLALSHLRTVDSVIDPWVACHSGKPDPKTYPIDPLFNGKTMHGDMLLISLPQKGPTSVAWEPITLFTRSPGWI